ncbi:hypothetical protein BJY04DRAFT_4474 [Aspergillus karnatakaensis]|uniref:uncharacterized protein n=1 Tax=Aspergillus karnatakaensis TaxID=1810916 RepID=UPI003CCD0073
MAIWPFGRRGKRHTIQVDADPRAPLSQSPRHSFDEGKLGRKPSRKQSKRRKNRHSEPVEEFPTNLHDVAPPVQHIHFNTSFQSENNRPTKAHTFHVSSTADAGQSLSRKPSLRKPQRNESRASKKNRLSNRKAYDIAREREIRLMASTPIDIPRRATTPAHGDPMQIDGRHTNSAQSRRLDRHRSDISLSIQESAASSLSDFSETYTFKVNAFAAWTPRPVIRYVEAPRTSYSGHRRTPEPAERRKSPTLGLEVSEEDLRSKKRIDELADDFDAGDLRELMERDRRRRERKHIEDQEKLVRKLQRNARKVPKFQEAVDSSVVSGADVKELSRPERGRTAIQDSSQIQPTTTETEAFLTGEPEGSWLRESSRDVERERPETAESVHVVGNIDDSSIRERKAGQRLSFGPSNEMAISRSTLSPSLAPSRHGLSSPDSSQFYGMTRESISDLSRNVDSERRLSDHSGGRVNPITSIFRRGSSRLKRSYRERFQDRSPPPASNVSNESFFKVQTQTQPPTPYVPPIVLRGPSSFKRSQSKFTEHFNEEPLSPPDSRIQSPEVPEDGPAIEDQVPDLNSESFYPIPGSRANSQHGPRNRHHSWTGDNEDDPENLPLSQSLASVDSEGSWMSGQFLRRISQKPTNSARQSLSSSRNKTDDTLEKASDNNEQTQFVAFGAYPGEDNNPDDQDKDLDAPQQPDVSETWHQDIGKRAVLINPAVRPKSTAGLLNNVRSLSQVSADEGFGPIEEHSAELLVPPDHDTVNTTQAHHR